MVSIDKVTLCQVQLVSGCVTIFTADNPPWYVTRHWVQLSLAMSRGQAQWILTKGQWRSADEKVTEGMADSTGSRRRVSTRGLSA